jgi:hypothetical protein
MVNGSDGMRGDTPRREAEFEAPASMQLPLRGHRRRSRAVHSPGLAFPIPQIWNEAMRKGGGRI